MKTKLMKIVEIFNMPEAIKVDYDTIKVPLTALEGISIVDCDSHIVRISDGFLTFIELGAGG